jgi:hypothetical protein
MMRKCRQCGFPRKFARFFEWRPDGTILSTDRTGSRTQITFLDAGEFESIFEGLSRSIGHDVDSFLTRSYRDIGKTVYRNTSSRYLEKLPNNRFFRPQFLARLIIRRTAGDVAMLGDGRLRMDHFRAGESVVLRFENPCVNQLLAGSAAAMYESVEGIHESVIEYDVDDGGDLVIRLARAEGPTEEAPGEDRFHLDRTSPIEGPVRYERCIDCGAPLLASLMLEWDMERGVINNRITGEREVIVAAQAVNAILRELEKEFGTEIGDVVFRHQKELSRKRLRGVDTDDLDRFWDEHMTDLALRGLGYPIRFERGAASISIEIINAYNQVLYAARIAAAFEATTGFPTEIKWEKLERDHGAYEIFSGVRS